MHSALVRPLVTELVGPRDEDPLIQDTPKTKQLVADLTARIALLERIMRERGVPVPE